jgi:hypothetical protein
MASGVSFGLTAFRTCVSSREHDSDSKGNRTGDVNGLAESHGKQLRTEEQIFYISQRVNFIK